MCEYLANVTTHCLKLFEKIVKLFVTVLLSQFRKDYLRIIQREKGKALRKKVVESKEKKMSESITFDFIKNDKSKDKEISHHKLKAMALQNELFYTNFKKDDLICLIRAYNEVGSKKKLKKELGETLLNVLKKDNCVRMVNVSIFDQSHVQENTEKISVTERLSTESVNKKSCKGKQLLGKRKAQKKSSIGDIGDGGSVDKNTAVQKALTEKSYFTRRSPSDQLSKEKDIPTASCSYDYKPLKTNKANFDKEKTSAKSKCKQSMKKEQTDADDYSDACGICLKLYKSNEDMICCNFCNMWYHRGCIGLDDDNEWNFFLTDDAIYICPMCQ